MKKLFAAITAIFASLIMLCGCAGQDPKTQYTSKGNYFYAMNAEATLVVSDEFTAEKQQKFNALCDDISSKLYALESSLSSSDKNSSIAKFNEAEAGDEVPIDYTAYKVLTLAKSVYELTDGYYNPAVYYSVQAYGFNDAAITGQPSAERIPSDSLIAKYNALSAHFGEIELKEENGKYYAVKPDATVEIGGVEYSMKIDLGGIGKGYAVDEINAIIDGYGFKYGYLSFGASSILFKEHYAYGDYTLGFINPRSGPFISDDYIQTKIKNERVSSSGDYEQYFLYDSDGDGVNERYCHVFDPTTGKPVQTGIMSATVIGGTAAEDDALTTAIMAMGKERAIAFINEKLSDRKVVFTYDDNGSYEIITNMPDSEYTVLNNEFSVVKSILN